MHSHHHSVLLGNSSVTNDPLNQREDKGEHLFSRLLPPTHQNDLLKQSPQVRIPRPRHLPIPGTPSARPAVSNPVCSIRRLPLMYAVTIRRVEAGYLASVLVNPTLHYVISFSEREQRIPHPAIRYPFYTTNPSRHASWMATSAFRLGSCVGLP